MLLNYNKYIVLGFIVLNEYNIVNLTNILLLLRINPKFNIRHIFMLLKFNIKAEPIELI